MQKGASIYQRRGAVFVSAAHRTQAGFWIDEADVVILRDANPANIGTAVAAALIRSREGVPTPLPSADLTAPLLAAAGVASWNTFAKSAKYVDVHQDDETVRVTPYRNLGGKGGFDPMPDKAVLVPSSDLELGEAVMRSLDMAE